MKRDRLFGSIEAGGTKFTCAVGEDPFRMVAQKTFPTTTPSETLGRVIEFFHSVEEEFGKIEAFGICSFGPVDLRHGSPTYGCITSTPKKGWEQTPIVQNLEAEFRVPIGFDTDVNGAALGERRWGAGQGKDTILYITVGTGIGGGALVNGQPIHGLVHPEMGHVRIPHDHAKDPFPGSCPYHGDCLEGLASGAALNARWGKPASALESGHPAWDLVAEYLGFGIVNYILTLSPEVVILGGGVMKASHLFNRIRRKVTTLLNQYVKSPMVEEKIETYIVPPALGDWAGIAGGFELALRACTEGSNLHR
ncbi:MAG: ROK family protein [Spirochaetes bacterium]|nr:ROK family protein [Spirochaetota bacterium]